MHIHRCSCTPLIYRNFDDKILLERVSIEVVVTKLTLHTRFSDDVLVNIAIKNEWRMMFNQSEFLSSDELISTAALNYCLEKEILDCIKIYTTTFIGDNFNSNLLS